MGQIKISTLLAIFVFAALGKGFSQMTGKSPLKIFILAGQSNMEGHGIIADPSQIGTLEYHFANDPDNSHQHLKSGNTWVTRDDVWIHYEPGSGNTIINGGLTVGQGVDNTRIGPELQFGHVIGDHLENQVLLIKTAWGGAALAEQDGNSFHPPSSAGATGNRYTQMLDKVNSILNNLKQQFPDYDEQGYELAGFGWHQGWNDLVNADRVNEYEVNMKNLIDDVRKDLQVDKLPFVVGLSGMHGEYENIEGKAWEARVSGIWNAQLAMADYDKYPEYNGNTAVAETRHAYRTPENSPGDAGYHWNRNAESYFLVGTAMGEAMKGILGNNTPVRNFKLEKKVFEFSSSKNTLSIDNPGDHLVTILNLNGKILNAVHGEGTRIYRLQGLKPGMYIVSVAMNNSHFRKKILVVSKK